MKIFPRENFGIIILHTDCMPCYDILEEWNQYFKKNNQYKKNVFFLILGERNDYWKQFENDFITLNIIHLQNTDCLDILLLTYPKHLIILNKDYQIKYINKNLNDNTKNKILKKYFKNEK